MAMKIDELKNENVNEVSSNDKNIKNEISNENSTMKSEVDPTKIIPKKEEPRNNQILEALDLLDKKSEEIIEKSVQAIKDNNEKILNENKEIELENDIYENEVIDNNTNNIDKSDEIINDDSNNDNKTSDEDEEVNERINKLKALLKDKLTPITNRIDISTYTINKNPTKVFDLFSINNEAKKKYIADWYLPNSNKMISMSEFTGSEINKLDQNNSSRTPLNTERDIFRLIWSHIENSNKPDFETWLKITHVSDIEHLYFAIYKASFDGVNTVPYYCVNDDCKEVFIKDVDILDMVEFENDVDKKAFVDILTREKDSHYTDEELQLDLMLTQITDNIAISIKKPSIFSASIEPLYLSKEFIEKNLGIYELVPYIEDIYIIDNENKSLNPVTYTEYKDSVAKTVASKYKTFIAVLKLLNSDQFFTFQTILSNMNKESMNISYHIPEQVCPKCGKVVPVEHRTALDILFTRHQLAAIANM